jgi:hypothetical protein
MRGKLFLDAKIYKNTDLTFSRNIYQEIPATPPTHPVISLVSASASFFGFGLLGGYNTGGEFPAEEGLPSNSANSRIYDQNNNSNTSSNINIHLSNSNNNSNTSSGYSSPFITDSNTHTSTLTSPDQKKGISPFTLRFGGRRASEGGRKKPLFGGVLSPVARGRDRGGISGADSNSNGNNSNGNGGNDGNSFFPPASSFTARYGDILFVQHDTHLLLVALSNASKGEGGKEIDRLHACLLIDEKQC